MTSSLCEAGVLAVPLIKSKYQQNQHGTGKEGSGVQSEFKVGEVVQCPTGTHSPYL